MILCYGSTTKLTYQLIGRGEGDGWGGPQDSIQVQQSYRWVSLSTVLGSAAHSLAVPRPQMDTWTCGIRAEESSDHVMAFSHIRNDQTVLKVRLRFKIIVNSQA